MLTYSLLNHNVYRIKRVRAVVYTFIAFLFGLSGAMAIAKINNLICSLKDLLPDIKLDMLGADLHIAACFGCCLYGKRDSEDH